MEGKRRRPRAVVDTSVLLAGIGGLRAPGRAVTPSGRLLHEWAKRNTFVWLVSEDILNEYKRVLGRFRVRRSLIGSIINRLREEAEFVPVRRSGHVSPDPDDDPFCDCAEVGQADLVFTLNAKDFPQERLSAKVVVPG